MQIYMKKTQFEKTLKKRDEPTLRLRHFVRDVRSILTQCIVNKILCTQTVWVPRTQDEDA